MRVLKFGGTSLATGERILKAAGIAAEARREGPVVVVVSALGGATNKLLAASEQAAARDGGWIDVWTSLRARHLDVVPVVASPDHVGPLESRVRDHFGDLEDLLHGVYLLRECSRRTRDSILAFGERLSAPLMAAALERLGTPAEAHDTRAWILTDAAFGAARVDFEATRDRVRAALADPPKVPVATGFIAATARGETTTLGRGGSDYTAAILGAALDAEAIELWTDVGGVMSADPRLVEDAFVLPRLTYPELMELSHFGAKVVHPPSVHPARAQNIPLVIKNTLDSAAPGTVISNEPADNPYPVRGISSIHRVALLRLEGDGMVGVPGIARRLFGALAEREVSVILISQGSSEHSICCAVAPEDAEEAREAIHREFELERRVGWIDDLVIDPDQSVIAVVGDSMRERPGLAARLFAALGRQGISVRAVAQGSSELNISVVIGGGEERRALQAVHTTFFHPRRRRAHVALLGPGHVGTAFLQQLADVAESSRQADDLDLRLVGVANTRQMSLARDGFDPREAPTRLTSGTATHLEELLDHLSIACGGPRILVDCTASGDLHSAYLRALESGVAIVAANKRPFSGPWSEFQSLRSAARSQGLPLRFEATVGAGLPVLASLESLLAAGDTLTGVTGVLSGTLNTLCEALRQGRPLSEAVRSAHAAGFTEPDPWDDLSGEDVRRKLCILARLAGHALEPEAIEVHPLLPGSGWSDLGREGLWRRLPRVDAEIATQQAAASKAGQRLRYVAEWSPEGGRIGLRALDPDHAGFEVPGPDNLIAFSTRRYHRTPLVLRGPGAGAELTASGVLADLLRVVAELRD